MPREILSTRASDRPDALAPRRLRRHRAAGFTLIEIMVVVFILGLLVTLVAPRIVGRTDEARRVKAVAAAPGFAALAGFATFAAFAAVAFFTDALFAAAFGAAAFAVRARAGVAFERADCFFVERDEVLVFMGRTP